MTAGHSRVTTRKLRSEANWVQVTAGNCQVVSREVAGDRSKAAGDRSIVVSDRSDYEINGASSA